MKIRALLASVPPPFFLCHRVGSVGAVLRHRAAGYPQLGTLGLTLFTFAIGINSGVVLPQSEDRRPDFWRWLPSTASPPPLASYLGKAMGMDVPLIAGTFAGSVTNTPALAAAGDASGDPARATVGHSIACLFGVIGMLAAAMAALHYGRNDATPSLSNRTIRVE